MVWNSILATKKSLKTGVFFRLSPPLTSQTLKGGGGGKFDLRGGDAMVVLFCKTFRQL